MAGIRNIELPGKGRWRVRGPRLLAGALGLVLLLLVAGWVLLQSDLPRRRVEAALAGKLGADVRLGKFTPLSTDAFQLESLEITRLGGQPVVRRVLIRRLIARGPAVDMLSGRFDRLEIDGMDVLLGPTPENPENVPEAAVSAVAGRILVREGTISLAGNDGGADVSTARFTLDVSDYGTVPRGSAEFEAAHLDLRALEPLGAPPLAGTVEDLRGSVEFTVDSALTKLSASAVEFATPAGTERLVDPSVEMRAALSAGGEDKGRERAARELTASMTASVPGLADLETMFRIDPETYDLIAGTLSIDRVDLARASGLAAPLLPGVDLAGDAAFHAEVTGMNRVRANLDATIGSFSCDGGTQLRAGSWEAKDGTAGGDAPAGGRLHADIEAEVAVRSIEGTSTLTIEAPRLEGSVAGQRVPRGLAPASLDLQAGGTLSGLGSASLAGLVPLLMPAGLDTATGAGSTVSGEDPDRPKDVPADAPPDGMTLEADVKTTLRAGAAGRIEASGHVAVPQDPAATRLDLRWTYGPARIESLVELTAGSLQEGSGGSGDPAGRLLSLQPRGELKANGSIAGRSGSLRIVALPVLGDGSVHAPRQSEIRGISATARLSWSQADSILRIDRQKASGTAVVPPLRDLPIEILAESGRFDTRTMKGGFGSVAIASTGSFRVHGDARWDGDRGVSHLVLDPANLTRIRALAEPLTGDLLPGYSTEGTLSAEIESTFDSEGGGGAMGTITVDGVGGSSDDGSKIVQGLTGSFRLEAALCPVAGVPCAGGSGNGSAISASLLGRVGGFELLWDSLYADGRDLTADVSVRAVVPRAVGDDRRADGASAPWRVETEVDLPGGPAFSAELAGAEEGAPMPWRLRIDMSDLGTAWSRYVVDPLGENDENLARFRLGGSLKADLAGTLAAHSGTASGSIVVANGFVAGREGDAEARAVDVELPLKIRWSAPAGGPLSVTGPPRSGRISFDRLVFRGLTVPAVSTGVTLSGDSVRIEKPVKVPLFGGEVSLSGLSFGPILADDRRLRAAIRVAGVDLARLGTALGLPALPGVLDASFPAVSLSAEQLVAEGGGGVDVFGGHLAFSSISGSDVFTPYPRLVFSASFRDIDLDQVTRTFDVGRITGILRGSVTDCELFAGTPVRFRAEFESVEREGVKQRMDVRAIRNVAILGTGSGVNIFDRGIQRFFQKYSYEKIGARMALEKDAFLIRGVAFRGDRELLLKGRLPVRVDVVLAEPGQTVSFQTMMERLSSVEFGGVASPS